MLKSLSRKEFDVLEAIITSKNGMSQRQLSAKTAYSVSTVNRVLKALADRALVQGTCITEKGCEAMEPYAVQRAVLIAAGFGTRLLPITLNTPKPMVRVKGVRIVDRLLDALLAAGIQEIYIVRGYLAQEFEVLLHKYPMVQFISNPDFNEANNISSAMCAKDVLANAYVCEADILIHNDSAARIIKKYQYQSNTLGIKRDRTDDWCFLTNDGVIVSQQVGGVDCYQEIGISYLDEEDGKRLAEHLPKAYQMPGGKELFWDQVQLSVFKDEYKIEVRECMESDVTEIDTFKELKALDASYDI